jgi:hypothetical protein
MSPVRKDYFWCCIGEIFSGSGSGRVNRAGAEAQTESGDLIGMTGSHALIQARVEQL